MPCVTQMCVLDGNLYDAKVAEAGEEREDDLDAAVLPLNNKASPLLAAGPGARGLGVWGVWAWPLGSGKLGLFRS